MIDVFIGVDPGVSGGIAAVNRDGAVVFETKMPESNRAVLNAFAEIAEHGDCTAIIERVWTDPKFGASVFTFGKSYGGLLMALTASQITHDEVLPRKWQKAMSCEKQKDEKPRDHKNAMKRRAEQLFPRVTVTLSNADALLIAEYCRRVTLNIL